MKTITLPYSEYLELSKWKDEYKEKASILNKRMREKINKIEEGKTIAYTSPYFSTRIYSTNDAVVTLINQLEKERKEKTKCILF